MRDEITLAGMMSSSESLGGPEKTYVGIDFGTSTTTLSVARRDTTGSISVTPISVRQRLVDGSYSNQLLVPSAIAWYNGNLLIGQGADDLKTRLSLGKNLWHSFKIELGVDWGRKYHQTELFNGNEYVVIENPQDCVREFFCFLKNAIKDFVEKNNLPERIEVAVSIPASFEANQRHDLIQALDAADLGIINRALIDEPNAAFLSFMAQRKISDEGVFTLPSGAPFRLLVFDFGAGTCDVSVLEVRKGQINEFDVSNVALSKYMNLGGNNIDHAIAKSILLPQVLKHNKLENGDLTTPNVNRIIAELLGIAERLKIRICKAVSADTADFLLPAVVTSAEKFEDLNCKSIKLAGRSIDLPPLSLSYEEFSNLLKPFTDEKCAYEVAADDSSSVVSIFSPIRSCLEKASISKDDIDAVLLIGGSSLNPYFQSALSMFFSGSEFIVPQNLQRHVGEGAAIHSLLLNGHELDVIRPITSEPVLFETANQGLMTLVRCGTPMPSEKTVIKDLSPSVIDQSRIDIPIYVSGKEKLLHLVQVSPADDFVYSDNSRIELCTWMSSDKILNVEVFIDGTKVKSVTASPFANRPLSDADIEVFKAERVAKLNADNSGKPQVQDLLAFVEALQNNGSFLRAAETLEMIMQISPGFPGHFQTGYCYAMAGRGELSKSWFLKSFEINPDAVTAYNLAIRHEADDQETYIYYMEKSLQLNPKYSTTLAVYGEFLHRKKDPNGKDYLQTAKEILFSQLEMDTLNEFNIRMLIRVCEVLHAKEELAVVREYKQALSRNKMTKHETLLNASTTVDYSTSLMVPHK